MAQLDSQHRRIPARRRFCGTGVSGGDSACFGRAGQGAASARNDQFKHQVEAVGAGVAQRRAERRRGCHGKLLSDDFVGINMSGQVVTKMQLLDRMRRRRTVLTRLDLDDVHVKLIGRTAIVTSLANVEGANEGVAMHGTFRYTRVYLRVASGAWQITNYEATRVGATTLRRRRGVPAWLLRLRRLFRSEAWAGIATSGAKALSILVRLTARLKPCP